MSPHPPPPTPVPPGPLSDQWHVGDLTDDELADGLTTWAGRVAAGEARLLTLLAEFDRRAAWAVPGLLSCAHWLSWRIGLSPGAAREKVRVARALTDLPELHAAFAAGRLSYSQLRALTRVAVRGDEQRWIDVARHATAGQLERIVRGVARARAADAPTDPEAVAHRLRSTRSYDADGNVVYRIVVDAAQAAVLDAALEVVRRQLEDAQATAAPADRSGAASEADSIEVAAEPAPDEASATAPPSGRGRLSLSTVLLELADRVLDRQLDRTGSAGDVRRRLTVQVDPLSGWARLAGGDLLPPSVAAAAGLSVRGVPLRPLANDDLTGYDAGRRDRTAAPALRALLGTLDGERCRYPGCTRTRRLHAHHVQYWEDGGPTDLANLVLLCRAHHRFVHRTGATLHLLPDRRLEVCAGLEPLPHHPLLPWRPASDLGADVSAETLPPGIVERRVDLDYVVTVLCRQAA